MNYYPIIAYIIMWERDLEIQNQMHRSRRYGARNAEPELRPRKKMFEWIFDRIHRRQACEPSKWSTEIG